MIYVIVKERQADGLMVWDLREDRGYFTDKDQARAIADWLEHVSPQPFRFTVVEIDAA